MPKIAANFELGSPQPIDSRLVVEDDSALSSLIKYEGLEVYVKSTGLKKIYNGSDWVDFTADIATHYIDDKDQKQSINSQIKALVAAIDALSDDSGEGLASITTSLTNLQTAWDKFMNGTDTDTVIDTMNEIRLELGGKEDVGKCALLKHQHTKEEITDFPTSLPASDVSDWAKATTKPKYEWTEIDKKPTTFPPETHSHEQYLTAKDIAGKAEATTLVAHTSDSANPHSVTKDQLGLSDVRNVSSYSQDETDVLLAAKQDKGDYATKEELGKLDTRTTNMGEVVKTNTASIQSNASAITEFTTKLNNMGNSVSAHGKAISNIEDGTTTVKKAEQDSDGNNIVSTYATKDELTSGSLEVGAIQDQCVLGSSGLYLDDVFDLENGRVYKATEAEQDSDGNVIANTYSKILYQHLITISKATQRAFVSIINTRSTSFSYSTLSTYLKAIGATTDNCYPATGLWGTDYSHVCGVSGNGTSLYVNYNGPVNTSSVTIVSSEVTITDRVTKIQ